MSPPKAGFNPELKRCFLSSCAVWFTAANSSGLVADRSRRGRGRRGRWRVQTFPSDSSKNVAAD
jgi:hypothetical protein